MLDYISGICVYICIKDYTLEYIHRYMYICICVYMNMICIQLSVFFLHAFAYVYIYMPGAADHYLLLTYRRCEMIPGRVYEVFAAISTGDVTRVGPIEPSR